MHAPHKQGGPWAAVGPQGPVTCGHEANTREREPYVPDHKQIGTKAGVKEQVGLGVRWVHHAHEMKLRVADGQEGQH